MISTISCGLMEHCSKRHLAEQTWLHGRKRLHFEDQQGCLYWVDDVRAQTHMPFATYEAYSKEPADATGNSCLDMPWLLRLFSKGLGSFPIQAARNIRNRMSDQSISCSVCLSARPQHLMLCVLVCFAFALNLMLTWAANSLIACSQLDFMSPSFC